LDIEKFGNEAVLSLDIVIDGEVGEVGSPVWRRGITGRRGEAITKEVGD